MQEYEKYIARWMLSTLISEEKKNAKRENVCLYPEPVPKKEAKASFE